MKKTFVILILFVSSISQANPCTNLFKDVGFLFKTKKAVRGVAQAGRELDIIRENIKNSDSISRLRFLSEYLLDTTQKSSSDLSRSLTAMAAAIESGIDLRKLKEKCRDGNASELFNKAK